MRKEISYFASDGTEFKSEWECKVYEAKLNEPRLEAALKDYIVMFSLRRELLPYNTQYHPSYVYVKKLPDWDNEEFMEVWRELIDENLEDEIMNQETTGWYVQDEGEQWHAWSKIEGLIKRYVEDFDKMSKFINPDEN